ncbi:MAG: hypothetical protein DMF63_01535 [Acidobacteria bacterium]|nr:MAG: hypothetical protein DMF63_01535 [Acidobacteriota bacterium]
MLTQKNFYRRDAETPRFVRDSSRQRSWTRVGILLSISLRLGVSAVIAISIGCGSKATDPRTVIPADALVYLESKNLRETLRPITENAKFAAAAKSKPNLNALDGVRVSIAVTGFQTSEEAVTEENAVLNFQPRLVAVVETNAWGWQARSFIEDQLGEFVNEVYDGEVEMQAIPRDDGKFYTWKAKDGRKAYALQQGSLIFFGNDESAIERCLAVKRGEAESIAKNSKVTDDEGRLAFGYVSPEGVGQIANIAGAFLAKNTSEEEEVQSFVARVLPEILRNSLKELTWTMAMNKDGIEDKAVITLDDESSRVFGETIVPGQAGGVQLTDLVPASAASASRYVIKDPQIAWRSLVLTAQKKTDQMSGSLIGAFSDSFFEPYGIENPEVFLSSVGSQLVTVKMGPDADDAAVIASITDPAKIRISLAKELNFSKPPEKLSGADVWKSEDGEVAAAFLDNRVIVGDADTVLKCLEASGGNSNLGQAFASSDSVATTAGSETDPAARIVELFSERKNENEPIVNQYRTETRFNKNGVERRTISDFGLLGSLLEHLASE